MARLPLPARRRRAAEEGAGPHAAAPAPPPPPRRAAPPAGVLRRERRLLLRTREHALRDLGGLLLEMYRRDLFREDLLRARCAELVDIDVRLHEIEILLAGGDVAASVRCACGAPLVLGAHFCANCGRPASGEAPVVACSVCAHPLAADARFCASCGSPADVRPDAGANGAEADAAPAAVDPWER
jgi:hypothetical protein